MVVKFKRYNDNATIPQKACDGDFCYDVYAVSKEEVAPNVWKYGLGFGLQIERDWENIIDDYPLNESFMCKGLSVDISKSPINLSIDFRPRSSIYKTGMVMANSTPTIDEGYTGEIFLIFYHVMPNMKRYEVGDKIAQCKIGVTFPIVFTDVEEFNKTERGDGGFGHSGK